MAKSTAATATRAGSSPPPLRFWTGRTTSNSVTMASTTAATMAMATAGHRSSSASITRYEASRPATMAYGPIAKLKKPAPTSTR
jgi:hypothetical protein